MKFTREILIFLSLFNFVLGATVYVNQNSSYGIINCGSSLGTACPTIYSAFSVAITGDTILIEPGIYSGTGNEGLTSVNLSAINLNIVGNHYDDNNNGNDNGNEEGVNIVCKFEKRWLHSQNQFLSSISNITIKNCSAYGIVDVENQEGGALFITDSPNIVTLKSVIFQDNIAFGGGAISLSATFLTVIDCKFIGNKAAYSGGGILSRNSEVVISHSFFEENFAGGNRIDAIRDERGGGVFADGGSYLTVQSSFFISNTAGIGGGAIYGRRVSNFDLNDCYFLNNSAYGGDQCSGAGICDIRGGAVFVADSTSNISYCSFVGNEATTTDTTHFAHGGALVIAGDGISVIQTTSYLINCSFINNTAQGVELNSPGGYGGAIYSSQSYFYLINCTFHGNQAISQGYFTNYPSYGGALYLSQSSITQLTNNLFHHNLVNSGNGGAVYLTSSSLHLSFNLFQSNIAYSSSFLSACGGALFIDDSLYSITYSSFQWNYARPQPAGEEQSFSGQGGAINFKFSNGKIYMSIFESNTALPSKSDFGSLGGAINFEIYNEANLTSLIFQNNTATFGGAISFQSKNTHVFLSRSSFVANIGLESGGCCYLGESNNHFSLSFNTFHQNSALKYGGVFFLNQLNLHFQLVDSDITHNHAELSGGVLYSNSNQNMTIIRVRMRSCTSRYGGSIFFGYRNEDIRIENTEFIESSGINGGAIYISPLNSELRLLNCSFLSCLGDTGGAITSLSEVTLIDSCLFQLLFATNSILAIIRETGDGGDGEDGEDGEENFLTLQIINSIFENNRGPISVTGTRLILQNSIFRNNFVAIGGSLMVQNSPYSRVFNCSFLQNYANDGGAAYFHSVTQLFISSSLFSANIAIRGGSLHLQNISSFTMTYNQFLANKGDSSGGAASLSTSSGLLSSNLFHLNVVQAIGGSSLFLSSCSLQFLYNNFTSNSVLLGGGTIFWTTHGMKEPTGLNNSTLNLFFNNTASYGDTLATQGVAILTPVAVYNVTQYDAPIPSILVSLLDYYNHTITSDSVTNVEVYVQESFNCSKYPVSLVGSKIVKLSSGLANFSGLFVYCAPGGMVPLEFRAVTSSSSSSSSTTSVLISNVTLYFRRCYVGEYSSGQECLECEVGTYSLTQKTSDLNQISVCKPCPDHTSTCYGSTLVLESGYWRISSQSSRILSCPYGSSACQGGELVNQESCHLGYEGPLCAVCQDGYALHTSTNRCIKCEDSRIDIISLVYLTCLSLLVLGLCYSYFYTDAKNRIKSIDDLIFYFIDLFQIKRLQLFRTQKQAVETVKGIANRLRARIKVYVTMYQILSCLPFVLDFVFPYPINSIVTFFNILNISLSQSPSISCSYYSVDFIDLLVIDTTLPLCILLFLWGCQKIHVSLIRDSTPSDSNDKAISKISSNYFTVMIAYTYYILPSLTSKIFQTFSCKDVDQDDLNPGSDIYMTVDYSISCTSSKYYFAFYWALVMIGVYPIGIPLYYLHRLWQFRQKIQTNHPLSYSRTASIEERLKSIATIEKETQQQQELSPLRLLFFSYKSSFWWWEIMEIYQRITLVGILVVIAPGSPIQIVVGGLLTLLFLYLYAKYEPFHDSVMLSFKILSYWQIFFVFWIALLIKSSFSSIPNPFLGICLIFVIFANIMNDCLKLFFFIFFSSNFYQKLKRYLFLNEIEMIPSVVDHSLGERNGNEGEENEGEGGGEGEGGVEGGVGGEGEGEGERKTREGEEVGEMVSSPMMKENERSVTV